MATIAEDALDPVMRIMDAAFDPAFGEAWTRRQVGDSLTMPSTHILLVDMNGLEPASPEDAAGFAMSRCSGEEEELLLIAVLPSARGRGVGTALLDRFARAARERGVSHLFLEMREGNPAAKLYLRNGFVNIGRRRDYYRAGRGGPFDALTFAREID